MQLRQIADTYPRTHRLVRRLVEAGRVHPRCIEGMSEHGLRRIESGETSERDAELLLHARGKPKRKENDR